MTLRQFVVLLFDIASGPQAVVNRVIVLLVLGIGQWCLMQHAGLLG